MAYSGLTPTIVLRFIKRMLGSSMQYIELSDDEIMEVVYQQSVPVFSKFFPFVYPMRLGREDARDNQNTYYIKNKENLEIFGIHDVKITDTQYYGRPGFVANVNPFNNQIMNDMFSMTRTPITWTYYPPYKLTLRPKIIDSQRCVAFVKAVHPRHLKSIPVTMREHFLNLCLYDVLLSLYPLRHRFATLETPIGAIQLFMDQVDSAEEKRRDLLEYFERNYIKNGGNFRIRIY